MARVCEVCSARVQKGNQVETRGKAKYLGGVGTKITGCTRRTFTPNLQNVKISLANGTVCHARVCVRCLRSGAVRKAVKQKPFNLPTNVKKAGSA